MGLIRVGLVNGSKDTCSIPRHDKGRQAERGKDGGLNDSVEFCVSLIFSISVTSVTVCISVRSIYTRLFTTITI